MTANEIRSRFLQYFAQHGHTIVPSSSLVPANDPTLLFVNSGHGPVQGRVSRRREAAVRSRNLGATVPPRGRQAQRSRKCRLHGAPPYVLRNARQLVVRRLFQARCDPVCVGALDEGLRPAAGKAVDDRLCRRRRGLRAVDEGHRGTARTLHPDRRQQGGQVRKRQFLADGRHRPVRAMLGNLLRPRPGSMGRPPGIGRIRGRSLHRDLEPRVHAVRQANERRRNGQPDAAARAVRRHRDGARTPRGRSAARAQQLRDRSLPGPDPRRSARDRRQGFSVAEPARDRRSHPGMRVPDRRRRDSVERRARLCAAPDHPPRDPSRLPARPEEAFLPQARPRPRPRDGRRLPRAAPREDRASRRS